ncbi:MULTISPECIES: hypothetical protein [Pseudomonas]|uniref:hypothetical protein n=1 Tax=Pseudomonas TaxID=286 RepID=UPI000427A3C9|nr:MULTISPECIES: hypothetical protein [Pseudomonas]MCW2271592.1 hypothetical protein [Pseudomonas sp. JUb96]
MNGLHAIDPARRYLTADVPAIITADTSSACLEATAGSEFRVLQKTAGCGGASRESQGMPGMIACVMTWEGAAEPGLLLF